ncbi:MAG: flagellar hook-associated protein FlgL [Gammaproteobacteria bacterium]|nr:flagellar hook-associated protein FlgL [Gammaproteobacteria bacterium]
MRVSTNALTQISLNAMLKQQLDLSKTQLQVTNGKRLTAPSDDPYGSARSLDLMESVNQIDQYQVNSSYAKNRLSLEEGTLDGVGAAAQRLRELMVLANNDSQNVETRRFIKEEVDQLLDQLVSLGNTVDSNGEYIFSGFQGKTKPFSANSLGGFDYFGDDGQRFIKMSESTSISMGDSGSDVFLKIKNGNGTFKTSENATNLGTGIIDPGTELGPYVPGNYQVKFLPPSSGNLYDPQEYYVLDSAGVIIEPVSDVGSTEAAFVTAIEGRLTRGVTYEEGATVQGLDKLGIKISLTGAPSVKTTPPMDVPLPPPAVYTLDQNDGFTIDPSNNQSMFETVKNFSNALVSAQSSPEDLAHFHNSMNRALTDLDESVGRVLEIRARIGARLNTVDKQLNINEAFSLQMNTTLSSIQDLDYSEAITRLNLQLTGLQAAQSAYTKIQGLSLFNYL